MYILYIYICSSTCPTVQPSNLLFFDVALQFGNLLFHSFLPQGGLASGIWRSHSWWLFDPTAPKHHRSTTQAPPKHHPSTTQASPSTFSGSSNLESASLRALLRTQRNGYPHPFPSTECNRQALTQPPLWASSSPAPGSSFPTADMDDAAWNHWNYWNPKTGTMNCQESRLRHWKTTEHQAPAIPNKAKDFWPEASWDQRAVLSDKGIDVSGLKLTERLAFEEKTARPEIQITTPTVIPTAIGCNSTFTWG